MRVKKTKMNDTYKYTEPQKEKKTKESEESAERVREDKRETNK